MSADTLPATGVRATLTRLADCLLLGAAISVASLGVVTIGPALAAAARVVRGWESGDQPPIVATFVAAIRRETVPLLLPQLALVAAGAFIWVDLAVAGTGLPGAWLVRLVAGLGGVVVLVSYLAMFALRTAPAEAEQATVAEASWWAAWGAAARLCARRPWLPVAVAAATSVVGLCVAVAPATVVVAAGPLMLAVGVLVSRAERR